MIEQYKTFYLLISIYLIFNLICRIIDKKKIIIYFLFVGTVLHELSHAIIVLLLLGRIKKISFGYNEKNDTLAEIEVNNNKISFISSLAPIFILPLILYFIIDFFNINLNEINILEIKYLPLFLISLILIISSKLSISDLKIYFENFFSIVNILFIVLLIDYLKDKFNLNDIFIFINQYQNLFQSIIFLELIFLIIILISKLTNFKI